MEPLFCTVGLHVRSFTCAGGKKFCQPYCELNITISGHVMHYCYYYPGVFVIIVIVCDPKVERTSWEDIVYHYCLSLLFIIITISDLVIRCCYHYHYMWPQVLSYHSLYAAPRSKAHLHPCLSLFLCHVTLCIIISGHITYYHNIDIMITISGHVQGSWALKAFRYHTFSA